MVRKLEENEV